MTDGSLRGIEAAPDSPAFYVVADTHLGLKPRGLGDATDEPRRFGTLLRWLGRLEEDSDNPMMLGQFLEWLNVAARENPVLDILDQGEVRQRRLRAPTHLVLLGDILELWDGENQAILLSANPIADKVRQLNCKKIYVLGNHDNVLAETSGQYPFGEAGLDVVTQIYPEPGGNGAVRPLPIGVRSFIFLHGHQLDFHFVRSGGAWRILPYLRHFGAATGNYAWLFGLLAAATLASQTLSPSPLGWLLFAGFVLLWVPRFYMTFGRRLWKKLSGARYDRDRAFKGFERWWAGFHMRVERGRDLGVVYGHTHIMDWIGTERSPAPMDRSEERLRDFLGGPEARPPTLYNVSSWVTSHGDYNRVVRATILYIDQSGPLMLGWDWASRRPFHVPHEFIVKRRRGQALSAHEEDVARRLRWPEGLICKWQTTNEAF